MELRSLVALQGLGDLRKEDLAGLADSFPLFMLPGSSGAPQRRRGFTQRPFWAGEPLTLFVDSHSAEFDNQPREPPTAVFLVRAWRVNLETTTDER